MYSYISPGKIPILLGFNCNVIFSIMTQAYFKNHVVYHTKSHESKVITHVFLINSLTLLVVLNMSALSLSRLK